MDFLNILVLFPSILAIAVCFQTRWESNQFQCQDIKPLNQTFQTDEEAIIAIKDFINQTMIKESIPGLTVGLSVRGKTQFIEAFGKMDVENNVKTHKNAIWRLAGISKALTSVLVGRLIDESKLELSTPIQGYLPKGLFPKKVFNGKKVKITLNRLLSHTAGMQPMVIPNDMNVMIKTTNVSQTLSRFKDQELISRPGDEFVYSNNGYQLVGAIIESVHKSSFQSQLKKMCLKFGMNSTFAEKPSQVYRLRPRYYQPTSTNDSTDRVIRAGIIDDLFTYNGFWPSAGIVSTVGDLLIFGKAIVSSFKGHNERFLSQIITRELWEAETLDKTKPAYMSTNEYAKGWYVKDNSNCFDFPYKKLVYHPGNLLGSSALFFIFPYEEIIGVITANIGSADGLDRIALVMAGCFNQNNDQ